MLPGKEMFWYMDNEALHQRYFLSARSYNKNCQEWQIIWNACFLKQYPFPHTHIDVCKKNAVVPLVCITKILPWISFTFGQDWRDLCYGTDCRVRHLLDHNLATATLSVTVKKLLFPWSYLYRRDDFMDSGLQADSCHEAQSGFCPFPTSWQQGLGEIGTLFTLPRF